MPTNDERREVAAELRYTGNDCLDGGGLLPTLKRVLGVEGSWRKVFARLADLIEPEERTCRIYDTDHGFEDSIRCDACQMTFRRPWQPFKFCPNCGARVVDADA